MHNTFVQDSLSPYTFCFGSQTVWRLFGSHHKLALSSNMADGRNFLIFNFFNFYNMTTIF